MKKINYDYYRIYECPARPDEYGTYIGCTSLLDQAKAACNNAKKSGRSYFITGVTFDGVEILIL